MATYAQAFTWQILEFQNTGVTSVTDFYTVPTGRTAYVVKTETTVGNWNLAVFRRLGDGTISGSTINIQTGILTSAGSQIGIKDFLNRGIAPPVGADPGDELRWLYAGEILRCNPSISTTTRIFVMEMVSNLG